MNIKKIRQPNLQVANMERLNRGDLMEKSAKDLLSEPADQGDIKNKNLKNAKPKIKNVDTKTKKDLPLPTRDQDVKPDETFNLEITELKTEEVPSTDLDEIDSAVSDYRKRVKDRYTLLKLRKEPKKLDVNVSPMMVEKNGIFTECQMQPQKKPVKTVPLRKFNENKQPQKTQPINKAVSVMKIKPAQLEKKDLICIKESKNEKNNAKTAESPRRPIIKTITKHDTVFKDVKMFVDKTQPTPLRIRIPIKEDNLDRSSSLIHKMYTPPADKTETPLPKGQTDRTRRQDLGFKKKRVKKETKRAPQVTDSKTDNMAKLVPESTNQYTKPYYEAWVNKRLAATSKLKGGEYIAIQDEDPDMRQRCSEHYAGKIRVRQKIFKERQL